MGMISSKILDLLQTQYKHESSNHFRYVARSSWSRYRGLEAAGDFFAKEAEGEAGHAKIVRDYIESRNEAVDPAGFDFSDASQWNYYDELFTTAQQVEYETTDMLNNIYSVAMESGDFMTSTWVQGLITEQIEEENLYQTMIDRIVQRGGGVDQVTAINAFRKDISAVHDFEIFLSERNEDE